MSSFRNSNLVSETLQAGDSKGAHVGVVIDDKNAGSARRRKLLWHVLSGLVRNCFCCSGKVDPNSGPSTDVALNVHMATQLPGDPINVAEA
jgi:hypothetical protein